MSEINIMIKNKDIFTSDDYRGWFLNQEWYYCHRKKEITTEVDLDCKIDNKCEECNAIKIDAEKIFTDKHLKKLLQKL